MEKTMIKTLMDKALQEETKMHNRNPCLCSRMRAVYRAYPLCRFYTDKDTQTQAWRVWCLAEVRGFQDASLWMATVREGKLIHEKVHITKLVQLEAWTDEHLSSLGEWASTFADPLGWKRLGPPKANEDGG